MRTPYECADDGKSLKMPVMLVYGDSDMFRPEHIVEFYHLLGGGLKDAGWMREHMAQNRLAILPDLTHYEIFASPTPPRPAPSSPAPMRRDAPAPGATARSSASPSSSPTT